MTISNDAREKIEAAQGRVRDGTANGLDKQRIYLYQIASAEHKCPVCDTTQSAIKAAESWNFASNTYRCVSCKTPLNVVFPMFAGAWAFSIKEE